MAAYAALLSVKQTINETQQHPRPPISLHHQQLLSLTQNLDFLQDFLERYPSSSSEEEEALERRIADAAHAAEDEIESHIVDQIHATQNLGSVDLYENLERVIEDMDSIKKEVVGAHLHQLRINPSVSTALLRSVSSMQNNTMVDFGDILNQVLDKLTGQDNSLQIIPIVGMGGIGKTTLARNIFTCPLIVQHFYILSWVTISQEYSRRGVLQVLCGEIEGSRSDLSLLSENEIGQRVYKNLYGRRYLIVIDDIWSIEAWDKVKSFFPKNNNGSKIMITTRLSNLAFQLSGSHDFEMKFLDEHKSWDLLCKIVFAKEGCPVELENIGKEIAKKCRGLPLSIVVIGGLLTNSKMTQKEWEFILENLSSLINLENKEHCLQILGMSYKELPIHLKPCFLYMGAFAEDDVIHVSSLIRLWVAEGFLKPIDGISLEVVAEKYFNELIERNLLLVNAFGLSGKVKYCKIHDLIRDLCLREAQKQRFLYVRRHQDVDIPQGINTERHISIHEKPEQSSPEIVHALESASLARSLLISGFYQPTLSPGHRLLRVYSRVYLRVYNKNHTAARDSSSLEAIFQQANLRYLDIDLQIPRVTNFPSWSLLWNLQTIKIVVFWAKTLFTRNIFAPSEIWKMSRLRHAKLKLLVLPDPPHGEDIVLENLQTLSHIWDLKFTDEVVKRIPNIKKLTLEYGRQRFEKEGFHSFCLDNLGYLQKLESLCLLLSYDAVSNRDIFGSHFLQNLTLPHSIKKLTLQGTLLHWEELTKIGSLPHLEVLKLQKNSCIGSEWITVDEQFCSLKFLLIEWCDNLIHWTTDSTHFPCLQHLHLHFLRKLNEIPSSIGDIPTLQSIHVKHCSETATDSSEIIKAEQEDFGNEDLKLHITRSSVQLSQVIDKIKSTNAKKMLAARVERWRRQL